MSKDDYALANILKSSQGISQIDLAPIVPGAWESICVLIDSEERRFSKPSGALEERLKELHTQPFQVEPNDSDMPLGHWGIAFYYPTENKIRVFKIAYRVLPPPMELVCVRHRDELRIIPSFEAENGPVFKPGI